MVKIVFVIALLVGGCYSLFVGHVSGISLVKMLCIGAIYILFPMHWIIAFIFNWRIYEPYGGHIEVSEHSPQRRNYFLLGIFVYLIGVFVLVKS